MPARKPGIGMGGNASPIWAKNLVQFLSPAEEESWNYLVKVDAEVAETGDGD